jgi:hypothetical protein
MNTTFNCYLLIGVLVCGWFAFAAYNGWKTPSMTSSNRSGSYFYNRGTSYGRTSGGFWGGGK